MFGTLDISASALAAQRTRLDAIAGNIANADALERADGSPGPYRRRVALFAVGNPSAGRGAPGVHVARIEEDLSPGRKVYDPSHPYAAKSGPDAGYVTYPNVDVTMEYVNAIEASRAYEANVAVMEVTKSMAAATLRLLA